MTLSLLLILSVGLLFLAFVSLALIPFFPSLNRKEEKPLHWAADPTALGKTFRAQSQSKKVTGDYSSTTPLDLTEQIYVEGNAYIASDSKLKGFVCDKAGIVGHDVKISDWIEGLEGLKIGQRCYLGRLAASKGTLELGRGSCFKRLYGYPIATSSELLFPVEPPQVSSVVERAWFIGPSHVAIPSFSVVEEIFLSDQSVHVKAGARLKKDLKSKGNIHLENGVIIEGDLFAEGDIHIGPNCQILGHIVSGGEVFVSRGSSIGQKKIPKSVAGTGGIHLEGNVEIYGSVATEGVGSVC